MGANCAHAHRRQAERAIWDAHFGVARPPGFGEGNYEAAVLGTPEAEQQPCTEHGVVHLRWDLPDTTTTDAYTQLVKGGWKIIESALSTLAEGMRGSALIRIRPDGGGAGVYKPYLDAAISLTVMGIGGPAGAGYTDDDVMAALYDADAVAPASFSGLLREPEIARAGWHAGVRDNSPCKAVISRVAAPVCGWYHPDDLELDAHQPGVLGPKESVRGVFSYSFFGFMADAKWGAAKELLLAAKPEYRPACRRCGEPMDMTHNHPPEQRAQILTFALSDAQSTRLAPDEVTIERARALGVQAPESAQSTEIAIEQLQKGHGALIRHTEDLFRSCETACYTDEPAEQAAAPVLTRPGLIRVGARPPHPARRAALTRLHARLAEVTGLQWGVVLPLGFSALSQLQIKDSRIAIDGFLRGCAWGLDGDVEVPAAPAPSRDHLGPEWWARSMPARGPGIWLEQVA